eukprot:15297063-Alexandrium_andersonii.AAC.1
MQADTVESCNALYPTSSAIGGEIQDVERSHWALSGRRGRPRQMPDMPTLRLSDRHVDIHNAITAKVRMLAQ